MKINHHSPFITIMISTYPEAYPSPSNWWWASARAAGRLHHQRKHQLYLRGGSKFATSSEQFVEGGNNINYTFMRDQTSPLSMTYRLIGKITSTLSWWRIKISPPLWSNPEWDRNINLIVMRDQNLQLLWPILTGVATSTLSSWGIKLRHPLRTIYVAWGNNINFIFMRDQDSPPPYVQYVDGGNNINFIFMRDQKLRRRLRIVYVAFCK